MSDQSSKGQLSGTSEAVIGILFFFNITSVLFSAVLLTWAICELHYEGERWGLVFGIMPLGGAGLLIQLLLLGMTIWLASSARGLSKRVRLTALLLIIVAILLTCASLVCVFGESYHADQKNALYQSGLQQAVLKGDVSQASRILDENPALIRETNYKGNTALLLSVQGGDRPMVEMLLARGADPNSGHWDGTTPLHLAADRNAVGIAGRLLDKGARVNEEDRSGKTALARAKAAGSQAIIDLLTSRGGTDVDYGNQIVKAVEEGNVQQVAKLLDQGIKIDTSLPNGHCLLDFAAEKGNLDMAKLLISRGASVKRTDEYGRTALHWASGEGNAEMVGFLIDQGAQIDAKEHEGMTPLHEAVYWSQSHEGKSLETIKVLVGRGADVNARKTDGRTVLTWAEKYGTDQIRAYLASQGALKQTEK